MAQAKTNPERGKASLEPALGFVIACAFGLSGIGLLALATPFVLPALRKHCLPFVPATDTQLKNLSIAFGRHSKVGDKFLDIGSGDGRICRQASQVNLFSEVHGVELNSLLVVYSRALTMRAKSGLKGVKFHRQNLWRFPLNDYDALCIFGVQSMMDPLQQYLIAGNSKPQTIYACRFPFKYWVPVDEIGSGIDTVWVYKLSIEDRTK